MEDYHRSMRLLGLYDQNMPIFKESRVRRLESIKKMNLLFNQLPRLMPRYPKLLALDKNDPEWDDVMIYPEINWNRLIGSSLYWCGFTFFFAYNWNLIYGTTKLRLIRYIYPIVSFFILGNISINYHKEMEQVNLFENYCKIRAEELFQKNKYMLFHPDVIRYLWVQCDLLETVAMVHRQANNHDASDFKDSELILQDFIRRYSDENDPDSSLFDADGKIKVKN